MKNAKFNTHDVKKCCEHELKIDFRKGRSSEFNGWFKIDNKKMVRITVPKGRKYIPPKAYKTMAKQLKLSPDEFDELLECPLERKSYEAILREKD